MASVFEMANRGGKQVALSMWGLVERMHKPFDVAGDGTGPAVCPQCKTDWPCAESVRAFKEREALREELAR